MSKALGYVTGKRRHEQSALQKGAINEALIPISVAKKADALLTILESYVKLFISDSHGGRYERD